MHRNILLHIPILIVCLTFYFPAVADQSTTKALIVNGVLIPSARIDLIMETLANKGQSQGQEPDRGVRENLIVLELISQQAIREGLDKNPQTKNQIDSVTQKIISHANGANPNSNPRLRAQIDLAREQILAHALQFAYAKANPIKDDVLYADYKRMKSELGNNEYLVQHILVAKEDDARAIIADLKKGGDFEKIAKEKSIDTGSRDKGGKLDWATPVSYDKAFSDAMVNLKKGETTDNPVKSPFGYHVIRLIDIRPLEAPPFEQVKDRIRKAREQEDFGQTVKKWRSSANVQILNDPNSTLTPSTPFVAKAKPESVTSQNKTQTTDTERSVLTTPGSQKLVETNKPTPDLATTVTHSKSSALSAAEEKLAENPDKAGSWQKLGAVYLEEKNYFKAITAFDEAIKRNQKYGDAIYGLGAAYNAIGNKDKVRELYFTLKKFDAPLAANYFKEFLLP